MIIGYVRVSKDEQNMDLQTDALDRIGVELTFKEKVSGTAKHRPEFERMIAQLRSGDTVVVWRIDRLGRTMLSLVKLMVEFRDLGVEFISITEGINTSTQMGRLWFSLSAVFAENEHQIIKERTMAGLKAARARGRVGGRPAGLSDNAKSAAKLVAALYQNQETIANIRKTLKIKSNSTIYKYLRHEGVAIA